MTRTIGQWPFFLGLCLIMGFLANMPFAQTCMAEQTEKNQIRMDVDFTVLPLVLPGETEAPAQKAGESDLDKPEVISDPTNESTTAAAPEIPTPPKSESPAPSPTPTPEPPVAEMVTPAPQKTEAGTIESVSVTETDAGVTITVQTNHPVTNTSYMNLTDPRRLALDLHGPWSFHKNNVIRLKGAIKHIVIGEHPDRIRLVFHFRTPPAGPLHPKVTSSDTTLTTTLSLP